MKFIFCINNDAEGNLLATRNYFKSLLKHDILTRYVEYGYQPAIRRLGSIKKMENEFIQLYKDIKPDLIHWNQLNHNFVLSNSFIGKLYELNPNLIITQESVDSFKSIPKAMLKVGKKINLTLMNCGELVDKMNTKKCMTLLFPEKSTDNLFSDKKYKKNDKIVFIGNNNCSRNPFKYREKFGPRYRIKLIKAMKKRFGDKFIVYGRGWDGLVNNQGFLPYLEQERVMKEARFLFGCNIRNYYKYYFSNRLLNCMLSGTPVIYQHNPGYEELFEDYKHLFLFNDIEDALNKTQILLESSDSLLSVIGKNAIKLVNEKHTAKRRYEYYFKLIPLLKDNKIFNRKEEFFL
jgi:hypothetical protein